MWNKFWDEKLKWPGRDENVSKMDVDCRPGGRPVEKLSRVDVDQ